MTGGLETRRRGLRGLLSARRRMGVLVDTGLALMAAAEREGGPSKGVVTAALGGTDPDREPVDMAVMELRAMLRIRMVAMVAKVDSAEPTVGGQVSAAMAVRAEMRMATETREMAAMGAREARPPTCLLIKAMPAPVADAGVTVATRRGMGTVAMAATVGMEARARMLAAAMEGMRAMGALPVMGPVAMAEREAMEAALPGSAGMVAMVATGAMVAQKDLAVLAERVGKILGGMIHNPARREGMVCAPYTRL